MPPAPPRHPLPHHCPLVPGRLLLALLCFAPDAARASYEDIVARFQGLHGSTVFPVAGKTFDDIEETFGPRRQPSLGGAYDWHRGLDFDGLGGEDILAVYDAEFVKLDFSVSAGNYVVLKHTFAPSVTFGPNPDKQTWTSFYSYYMHLDDEVATRVSNNAWVEGSVISAGTHIGELGNTGGSGGAEYAMHLHFELRFGTSNPLSNQIDGDGLTVGDAWFDPHMHPLLLYSPDDLTLRGASAGAGYVQSLSLLPDGTTPGARTFQYTSSLDELPMLNAYLVEVKEAGSGDVVLSHTLDFNQRIGFDASTNALLDTVDPTKPYVAPQFFEDSDTSFVSHLVVPNSWLGEFQTGDYELTLTASDIWLDSTSLTVSAIPEPSSWAVLGGGLALGWAFWRRRAKSR